jgi:hypothetical protein
MSDPTDLSRPATDDVVEAVAKALYEAWAVDAGLHESWDDCARRGHSIVEACRKGARVAIAAYEKAK